MHNRVEQVHHSLDLNEYLHLHHKGWIAKHIGRAFIIAVLVCGAMGLFGSGWLSKQTARQGTAAVQYDRFWRREGETELLVTMTGVTGRTAVSFPLAYIQNLEIAQIVPQPDQQLIRSGQVWYVFDTDQNLLVHFYLKPQTSGNLHGGVWVHDQFIPLSHYIYP